MHSTFPRIISYMNIKIKFIYQCFAKIHVSSLCSYMKTILTIFGSLINVASHVNKIVKQLMISISRTIMHSTFPRIICYINIKIKFIYQYFAEVHVSILCSYMETIFTIFCSLVNISSHFKKIPKQFTISTFCRIMESSFLRIICRMNIEVIFFYKCFAEFHGS